MILYHGTSSSCLKSILRNGILPGKDSNKSNWENGFAYERSNDLVYVTDAPIQYAVNSSHDTGKGIIFELEIADDLIYPDPRYLIESHADLIYHNPEAWKVLASEKSLREMAIKNKGQRFKDQCNYCCLEAIPATSIRRYLVIDFKKRKSMIDFLFQEMSSRKVGFSVINELLNNPNWQARMPYLSNIGLKITDVSHKNRIKL